MRSALQSRRESDTEGSRRPRGRIEGLDGLRAIAVAAVLIFHLRAETLPGGFLGVDVFFVLSGFLITTLLVREVHKNGRINLPAFWLRRARRLIPAICLVVLVTVPAAWVVGGDLLVHIGRQVLGALTFSNNWLEIAAGSSYFAQTSPLLFVNFWSLAVEEQFYLVWPILLAILLAVLSKARYRIAFALALATASAVLMGVLVTPGQDATRAYYGTDTHVFGLMIGVALAFFWASSRGHLLESPRWARCRSLVVLLALAGLVALMLTLSESSVITFRGGIVLASVVTAILIAALLAGPSVARTVLTWSPIEWIGDRSYGIYLWHWPVILVVAAALPATTPDSRLSWIGRGVSVVLTLLISAASYRWLEEPVRRLGFREATSVFLADLRRTWPRALAAKITAVSGVLLLSACSMAIARAPEKSSVERQIEANRDLVTQSSTQASPTPSATPTPPPTGTAAPESSAPPSGHPSSSGTAAPESTTSEPKPSESSSGKKSPSKPDHGPFKMPSGDEITAFGDSLVVTSATGLADRFPGIQMYAESNRQWSDGIAVIRQQVQSGAVRRAVVIDFGTNGGIPHWKIVRDSLDLLGPDRMIVLVNLYGKSDWIPACNKALERIAEDYPNVIVADWHDTISDHPDMLQPDGVHPDIEGANLYADTVKAAFEKLAQQSKK